MSERPYIDIAVVAHPHFYQRAVLAELAEIAPTLKDYEEAVTLLALECTTPIPDAMKLKYRQAIEQRLAQLEE